MSFWVDFLKILWSQVTNNCVVSEIRDFLGVEMLEICTFHGFLGAFSAQILHQLCMVPIPHLNMDLFVVVFVGCCFSCGCCSINALGNIVKVYPEIVQGLTFYDSKV